MALVQCPDCGKMVSSRAAVCPECGCPAEFFKSPEVSHENNSAAQMPIETNVVKAETNDDITFHIAGRDVVYPGGRQAQLAKNIGIFFMVGEVAQKRLLSIYNNSKNIETALEKVPECAQFTINTALDTVMQCLYSAGVAITEEDFLEKYYFQYKIDYTPYYDEVVEKYGELLQLKEDVEEYRAMEKASRSQWVGGGFGVKGAIKGAITASIMNAGTDFIRSFGDRAKARKDEEQFQKLLVELYEDPKTKALLCTSIKTCIENLFFAYNDELISLGVADKKLFSFDKKRALTLCESTLKYETDEDKLVSNMLQCINLYPAERRFYSAMIGAIYANCDLNDKFNFYSFLNYWALDCLFPDDTSPEDPILPYEANIAKHVRLCIESDANNKNYYENWPLRDLSHGSDEYKEIQILTTQLKPGHTLLFRNDDLVITDRYISVVFGDSWNINGVDKLTLYKDKIRIYHYEDYNDENNNNIVFDEFFSDSLSKDDKEIIVTILNTFISTAETSEDEWKKLEQKHSIENASKNLPQDITSLDDYIAWRKFIYSSTYENNTSEFPLDMPDSTIEKFRMLEHVRKDSISVYDVLKSTVAFTWIPETATKKQFIDELRRTAIFFNKKVYGVNQLWYDGDDGHTSTPPSTDVIEKLSNEHIWIYKSYDSISLSGFAITDSCFVVLKDMTKILLSDIRDIRFDNKTLYVSNGINQYTIANSFTWDDVGVPAFSAIELILRLVCVRFSKNPYLSNALNAGADKEQAKIEERKQLEKSYEEQIEIGFGKNEPELKKIVESAAAHNSFDQYLRDAGIDPAHYSIDEFYIALRMLYAYMLVHDDSSIKMKDFERWAVDAGELVISNKLYRDKRLYEFPAKDLDIFAYCRIASKILGYFCTYLTGLGFGEGILSYDHEYLFGKIKGYVIYENVILNRENKSAIKWEDINGFSVVDDRNIKIKAATGDTIIEIYPKDSDPTERTIENAEFFACFLTAVKDRFYPNNKDVSIASSTSQSIESPISASPVPTGALNTVELAQAQYDAAMAKINEMNKHIPESALAYGKGKLDNSEGNIILYKDRVVFGWGEVALNEFEFSKIKRCQIEGRSFTIWLRGKFLQSVLSSENNELWVRLINGAMRGSYPQKLSHVTKEGIVIESSGNVTDGANQQKPSPITSIAMEQTSSVKSDTVFCVHCGNKIQRQSKFCAFCGKENKYGQGK